jgi:hypothetical protein
VSGHSTFSAAAADILSSFFGANYGFTYVDSALGSTPGVSRSFASFTQAAAEAGESRIYGGIRYEFDNQDGLTAGTNVGNWVLQAFNIALDQTPPRIVLDQTSGLVTGQDPTVTGTVTDNLSGVASLQMRLDGGSLSDVHFNGDGTFSVPINLALDGSADGPHTLSFTAMDAAGNTTPPVTFGFTLDSRAPQITLNTNSVQDGGALQAGSHLSGVLNGTGSAPGQLTYAFDGGPAIPIYRDAASGAFDQSLDLSGLSTGNHTLVIDGSDTAGNTTSITLNVSLPALPTLTLVDTRPGIGQECRRNLSARDFILPCRRYFDAERRELLRHRHHRRGPGGHDRAEGRCHGRLAVLHRSIAWCVDNNAARRRRSDPGNRRRISRCRRKRNAGQHS